MVDARYTEPLYRSHHEAMDDKTRLVGSFQEFTGNTVSPESISLAKACIQGGGPKQHTYEIIRFDDYLQQNQHTPSHLTMMTSAYDLLLKYVINLLKVKRPQVWRSIKTNNTAFKARVACMKGAEEILKNAGYTEPKENSMCFPDDVEEPNKARLSTIAAELLMAKLEVEQMNSAPSVPSSDPRQQHQTSSPRQQQRSVPHQAVPHTQPHYRQQGTQPCTVYQPPNSGLQPMSGYNSMAGSQPPNSGPQPMTGYNSSQPPNSGPQPMTGYNSMAGSQPPNSGPQPMTGYNSMAGSQPPNSGPQPMTGYNSSQPPTSGYNSMAGSQPPNSGPQPMSGYNSSQPPTNAMRGYNSVGGSQPPNSGPQPMTGYNSMAGSQPPNSGPQPHGYNSTQPPTNAMMAGFNSTQPPNNASIGYTNTPHNVYSPNTGHYGDGRAAGSRPGVTEVNAIDNRERSQMNSSSSYPPTSQSAVRREDYHDNQPPAQYRVEQSNTQPVPKPRRPRKPRSSNTPPTSPAPPPQEAQYPPHRDPPLQEARYPPHRDPPLQEARYPPHGDPPLQEARYPPYGDPPHDDPLVSMDSHRSSSGEMLSLTSSVSDDSPANSVVDKARGFLQDYRAKKKQSDTIIKQRTVNFTPSAAHSPQASRKASTTIHAALPPAKESIARVHSDPSVRSSEGFKQPPKKKQPSFHNDPILELPERNSPERPTSAPGPTRTPRLEGPPLAPGPTPRPEGPPLAPGPTPRPEGPPLAPGPTPMPRQPRPSSGEHSVKSPTNNSGPIDTGPALLPKLRYCSECNNKLGADNRFCAYCGLAAPPSDPPQSVRDPPQPMRQPLRDPPQGSPQDPPLRASHQDAVKAEEYHRRTQVINIAPSVPASITPVRMDTPPVLPPRATPRQAPPGPPKQAWEETVPPQQMLREPMPPPGPSKQAWVETVPPQQQMPPPGPPKQAWGETVPPRQTPRETVPPPIPPKAQSQASNSGLPHDATGMNTEAMRHMREKEEAWKSKQRKDGVKEEDLKPLCEPVRQDKGRQRVDVSLFPRTDTARPLTEYTLSSPGDAQRVEALNHQGKGLLHSVKTCLPWEYSLEEIQLAFSCDGRGLDYLQNEWKLMTEQAQRNLSLYKSSNQFSVGIPSSREMRKALAKAGGNIKTAEIAVFEERENKVKQLLERVDIMRGRSAHVPGLGWEGAVSVLSANGMDVDTAFYVLQCDWLKPLHDYIFDEKNKNVLVNQIEMEEIKKVITNKDIDTKCHQRLLMAECKFTIKEAEIVLQLLEEVEGEGSTFQYPLQYYIEAAKDHGDKARDFLIKECEICMEKYAVHEFVALPGCIHSVCKECFIGHFTLVINTQEVKHFTCPICGEPDMANKDITEDFYLQLFLQLIKVNLSVDCFKLCDDKLKEFSLSKDPNFVWCANTECRSGFIHEGRATDVACPNCRRSMCRKCKRKWEPAHEGISCESFAKWLIDNDPNAQELGLAAHLQANGIECPECHFKYDLARGGCMHFKCIKCPNEFCSGCGQSIKRGQECGKLESCKTRGLHSHHPRDCLFYLRDFDVAELQSFLTLHNIAYDTVPKETAAKAEDEPAKAEQAPVDVAPAPVDGAPVASGGEAPAPVAPVDAAAPAGDEVKPGGCKVMLQKESPEGLTDEECGTDVGEGHAGLCQTHYKEYLADLINKSKLDPITMYTTIKIEAMLLREEMVVPDKDDDDEEDVQRDKLIQHVKKQLPLPIGGEGEMPAAPQAIVPVQ